MDNMQFFRITLSGEKTWLPDFEIHNLRKDILMYYDDNVGEPLNVYLAHDAYKLDYWKYLSIGFEDQLGETERHKSFIEYGCLALINGITLDILDEPIPNYDMSWLPRGIKVEDMLPYLESYVPTNKIAETAQTHLLERLSFIAKIKKDDIDEYGLLKDFDLLTSAQWFDHEIVRAYFKSRTNFILNLSY